MYNTLYCVSVKSKEEFQNVENLFFKDNIFWVGGDEVSVFNDTFESFFNKGRIFIFLENREGEFVLSWDYGRPYDENIKTYTYDQFLLKMTEEPIKIKPFKEYIHSYVRDKKGVPYACFIAKKVNDDIFIDFSMCHKDDVFSKKTALELAKARVDDMITKIEYYGSLKVTIPNSLKNEFLQFVGTAKRYYKTDKIPCEYGTFNSLI